MPSPFLRWFSLVLVLGVALGLRTFDLSRRPMHSDEANQAVKFGELLGGGGYAFDPRDHHGPTLYYLALPVAWLRGEHSLAALDETTVRLVPAIAGTLSVLLLALLAAPLGWWPSLAAAAFLAVSPPAVYYSRYFIQETLLVTFTLGALVCAERWWRRGHPAWAMAAGLCAGLMQATKETAPLFALAGGVALFFSRPPRPASTKLIRDLALASGTAWMVAVLFYSSFGAHPAGIGDALASYGPGWRRASEGAGQEKPWWYYLRLFGWQQAGGLVWQQLAFSALALAGGVLALSRRQGFLRWAGIDTAIVALFLSLTPYKTPWHAVHLVPGLALLAAGAIAAFPRPWWGGLATAAVVVAQLAQTQLIAFTRPADPRNPYAYVHSSPDVLSFRPLAEAALARTPAGVVRVIGEEYWPIPWYLRGLPRVGYWSAPPEDCDAALVIATAAQAEGVRARLHGSYHESYLGLRPGVLCVVFTPQP